MKFDVELTYKESYYPASNRREEEKIHYITKTVKGFELKEVNDANFMTACTLENQRKRKTEYHYMDGHFWKRSLRSIDMYKSTVEHWGDFPNNVQEDLEKQFKAVEASAIVLGDTRNLSIADINDDLSKHRIYNGELWEQSDEPYYVAEEEDDHQTLVISVHDDAQKAKGFFGYNLNDEKYLAGKANAFKSSGKKVIWEDRVIEIGMPDIFKLGRASKEFEPIVYSVLEKEWARMFGGSYLPFADNGLDRKAYATVKERIVPALKTQMEKSFQPIYRFSDADVRNTILYLIAKGLTSSVNTDTIAASTQNLMRALSEANDAITASSRAVLDTVTHATGKVSEAAQSLNDALTSQIPVSEQGFSTPSFEDVPAESVPEPDISEKASADIPAQPVEVTKPQHKIRRKGVSDFDFAEAPKSEEAPVDGDAVLKVHIPDIPKESAPIQTFTPDENTAEAPAEEEPFAPKFSLTPEPPKDEAEVYSKNAAPEKKSSFIELPDFLKKRN